jgi:hypothetical protein
LRTPERRPAVAITAIQNVGNEREANVLFLNTESSGNNQEIAPGTIVSVGNAWIPWCFRERDFPVHHIQIVDTSSETVLFYIWQRNASDGDFVRVSSIGFEDPGAQLVAAGGSYNLRVGMGGVSLNPPNPA